MWQRFAEAVESFGTRVYLNTRVLSLERDGCHIRGLLYNAQASSFQYLETFHKQHAITALSNRLDPPPPDDVLQAAQKLNYRVFSLALSLTL